MKTRIYFLDNLRTFLILLVVILHSGLVYESVLQNSWIVIDSVKNESIGLIRMYLDLIVMFMIFFISGYFIPMSLKSKTSVEFLKSKFKRIVLPWMIAVFTLIPAYKFIFLYSRGLPQEEWYSYFHFFQRTGTDLTFFANNPAQNWLWFLPVLFLFQVIYLGLSKTRLLSLNITLKTGVAITFVLGVIYSVVVSELGLKGWYNSALLHFQRERFLIYFMSFLLGTLSYRHKVFDSSTKNKKLYIIANVVMTIAMSIFTAVALNTFFNIIDPGRNYHFISEFVDKVFYYASGILTMLSFLYVLVYAFRFSFNKTNDLMSELNQNSYAVYIIHTIVLGVIALTLMDLHLPAMVKFCILSVFTFAISNMIISSWRLTIQKQFNMRRAKHFPFFMVDKAGRVTSKTNRNTIPNEMKTIATIILVVLITGAAFSGNKGNAVSEQKQIASKESALHQGGKSIHAAVVAGDMESLKQLIRSGADLNEKEPAGGSSPLITACVFNKTEVARALIEAGADLNFKNNDGSTPLHTAAFFCRTEIVKALLENGSDATIRNNAGSTPEETVTVPFEAVEGIYRYFGKVYEPLGLKIDIERIRTTRTQIADIITKYNGVN